MSKKVLVTGGAGYIGSHTSVELLNSNYEVVIVDNLSNSLRSSINGIEKITNKKITFYEGNCCDYDFLKKIISKEKINSIIHFAASKMVGESVKKPLLYYENNLLSLLNVLNLMVEFKIKDLVFSSSCSVYGQASVLPVTEKTPLSPAESPYGNTKKIGEEIIKDTTKVYPISAIALRYFNVVGSHPTALIGDNPDGIPESIVPIITQVAAGLRDKLIVFGNDFDTPDGYQVRDYVHVVDLAKAHLKAVQFLEKQKTKYYDIFNIGTNNGVSVLGIINAFKKVSGKKVKYEIGEPRPGDVVKIWADTTKAGERLNWKAELDIDDAMRDAWKWQQSVIKQTK